MNEISRGYNKLIMMSLVILCVGIGVGSIYLMNTGVENRAYKGISFINV